MTHKTYLSTLAHRCGYWAAARHARNRGLSFDTAYWLIFSRAPRILRAPAWPHSANLVTDGKDKCNLS